MTETRLPYHSPALESLGSLVELTNTLPTGGGPFDGPSGYEPDVPPPGL